MINGFEKETAPLSGIEKKYVRVFVRSLSSRVGKDNAITANQITEHFKKKGIKLGGARVRKIINHIRTTGVVPNLLATANGYYVSNDPDEISNYIESLSQRIDAIRQVKEALEESIQKLSL